MVAHFDVYYVASEPNVYVPASFSVHDSWDGSVYIECNVLEACGPARLVEIQGYYSVWIGGHFMNCGETDYLHHVIARDRLQ